MRRIGVRLVPAEPQELGRGEAGERAVAGQLDQSGETEPILDLLALGRRSLVVPENRGANDPFIGVECDEPVHLTREADAGELASRRDLGERRLGCAPPVLRILLGPAGVRRRERIGRARRLRATLPSGEIATALTPVVPTSSPTTCCHRHAPSAAYTSS